ncbi:MAG: hypothetical protein COU63_01590 [Candidatus Pacebacteria bacterium CG10_big_fil_rev_8_21_14_0_10_36_11]|nr:hypothetical protein [Candidatus Pacearchaeota archaeon]OIP73720.1 MAG: hypothetical protein AUK08_04130 [Candidatus Pacebacteria bacterium CG2_30_36_39]PIR64694.1 MAG: hypothetical protein COU63_01590 [Candidatus Pacebacteria bacterium CG10_big_fil_rev_8_21_14_0_10_36_11]PJC43087.1 MAG: hypothetical protein CO040_01035 [Candidatus Pacebacteria bacterium CG_4_9_14_0_2_um_filter_36_8]
MTEQPFFSPETIALIIASRRKELTPIIIALLGFDPEQIDFIDPEKPTEEIGYQEEPAGEDPFEAVKFKLHRLLKLFQPEWPENKDLVFYASDVAFTANGVACYKPSRAGDELNDMEMKNELFSRYQKPFDAMWNIAFGAADKDGVSMGNIKIKANYPGLTKAEIAEKYSAEANPGLKLVEIGIEKGLIFELYLENDEEPIILNDEAGYKLIKQFIVQKLPTIEMFAHLIQREISHRPERYGLLIQSFISLQRYSIAWQSGYLIEIGPPSDSSLMS